MMHTPRSGNGSNSGRLPHLIFPFLVSGLLLLSGCATKGFLDGKEHELGEVGLVIDATIVHEFGTRPSALNVAENNIIGNMLMEKVGLALKEKGATGMPLIQSVGFGYSAAKPYEVMLDDRMVPKSLVNQPPYSLLSRVGGIEPRTISELIHTPASTRFVLPDNHGKPVPLLVVSATGKQAHILPPLPEDQIRRPRNLLLSMGDKAGRSLEDDEKDTISLVISLILPGPQQLLWEGKAKAKLQPTPQNFEKVLNVAIKEFPVSVRTQAPAAAMGAQH